MSTINVRLLSISILLMVAISCIKKQEQLSAIELSWRMPILDKERDTVFAMNGKNKLYFLDSLCIYQKEDILIDNHQKQHAIYTYWIYNPRLAYGLKYNPLVKEGKGLKFNVDSFERQNAFKGVTFYNHKSDKLHSSKQENGILVEKYIPTIKTDDSYVDTMVCYFNNKVKTPFYFSRELDSLKKSKLVKIIGIYNPIANSKYRSQNKKREMVFEIKETKIDSAEKMHFFFKKFKEEIRLIK